MIFVFPVLLFLASCESLRERTSFNNDWKFSLNADSTKAFLPEFQDDNWRQLNIPHDFSIESNFSNNTSSGVGGGALPGGAGWYRKKFLISSENIGKKVFIDFDGVYKNSKVYLNGELLGLRPNGYISFRYDLTPFLKYGSDENVLAVLADNSKQPNSRWYSGSGIFRNVWLVKTAEIHVDLFGTYVYSQEIAERHASVQVETTIFNHNQARKAYLNTSIYDQDGKLILQTSTSSQKYNVNSSITEIQTFIISLPQLWSIENPYLYTSVSDVIVDDSVVDQYNTTFGIRSFEFVSETGFYLNGESVKIKGVCLHHDLGLLGSAINPRALERQLQIMKDMGVNGIRTSHNPPAPELLDLCDRMGLLVMDESFDMWTSAKTTYDYHVDFTEWSERDLTDEIKRDRNHASVFMWSIGNEVGEQRNSAGQEIALSLAKIVRNLDKTRAVTSGNDYINTGNSVFQSKALDVLGFNYRQEHFETFLKDYPGQKVVATEAASALETRGYYEMPSDTTYVRDNSNLTGHGCSAYDNVHVSWGSSYEESWRIVKRLPHVSGMFIWTGFDYIGEPTPYGWPSRSSFFGIVDLAGFPKDIYYMFQSEWTNTTILHVFPHWNWVDGQDIDVWVFYNHADEVELYLNGVSLGVKHKGETDFHVQWRVKFKSGSIRALSRQGGVEVLSKEITTADKPAKIALKPDRSVIRADGVDLSFVTVEIQDDLGVLAPNATNLVKFSVEGDGFIVGTDNGDPNNSISLKTPERNAFYGKAVVAVQNTGKPGKIVLKAVSADLPDAQVEITVE